MLVLSRPRWVTLPAWFHRRPHRPPAYLHGSWQPTPLQRPAQNVQRLRATGPRLRLSAAMEAWEAATARVSHQQDRPHVPAGSPTFLRTRPAHHSASFRSTHPTATPQLRLRTPLPRTFRGVVLRPRPRRPTPRLCRCSLQDTVAGKTEISWTFPILQPPKTAGRLHTAEGGARLKKRPSSSHDLQPSREVGKRR